MFLMRNRIDSLLARAICRYHLYHGMKLQRNPIEYRFATMAYAEFPSVHSTASGANAGRKASVKVFAVVSGNTWSNTLRLPRCRATTTGTFLAPEPSAKLPARFLAGLGIPCRWPLYDSGKYVSSVSTTPVIAAGFCLSNNAKNLCRQRKLLSIEMPKRAAVLRIDKPSAIQAA